MNDQGPTQPVPEERCEERATRHEGPPDRILSRCRPFVTAFLVPRKASSETGKFAVGAPGFSESLLSLDTPNGRGLDRLDQPIGGSGLRDRKASEQSKRGGRNAGQGLLGIALAEMLVVHGPGVWAGVASVHITGAAAGVGECAGVLDTRP